MSTAKSRIGILLAAGIGLLLALAFAANAAEESGNLLANPSFEEGANDAGMPTGWSLYGGTGPRRTIRVLDGQGVSGAGLLIDDSNRGEEVGVTQRVAVKPGTNYVASVKIKAVGDASTSGSYIQFRFLPSGEFSQSPLRPGPSGRFAEAVAGGMAPEDTTHAVIYLYTHRGPTPKVILDDAAITAADELPDALRLRGRPEAPDIPALKDLHLTTELVKHGEANAVIVAPAAPLYDAEANAVRNRIRALTGIDVPVVGDDSVEFPLAANAIILGNRSTNALISKLYERFYALIDLRYPGAGGHVVRTLHNPFGNGFNAVLLGGSDKAGVRAAAEAFAGKLAVEPGSKDLSIGWMTDIQLGDGIDVPADLREFDVWDASAGYRSVGYFGWNSISKRMAMYYMTGDPFHAREALRLAFPDEQAKKEIAEIDGERIENKDTPLGGPYHYNAHMMILFWDLIEESPVFTDEERLRVTRAFAEQLEHHGIVRAYVGPNAPVPAHVGSRHGQWTAISLYCLGRYFAKDYDNPIWPVCEENGALHFASLHEHAWVSGENDNLFWYSTAIAPIFTYLLLSGDRVPLENGVVGELLRGLEILSNGRKPDWALQYASIGFLHKAAYLTDDGRWLGYRDRTGVALNGFRLGQSYWPDAELKASAPNDLANTWQVQFLPEPMWRWRNNGFPLDESFLFMSYRDRVDAAGDFVLLDGFNGASRNPYHTFAVLELRQAGVTALKGYRNQVMTRVDGMTEPKIAMNAALRHYAVLGDTAVAIGEVSDASFVTWRRSLIQRVGRHTVIVDELTSRVDSENLEVQVKWEAEGGSWKTDPDIPGKVRLLGGPAPGTDPEGWYRFDALDLDCRFLPERPNIKGKLATIVLLRGEEPGDRIEMPFTLAESVRGETTVRFLDYIDRGVVRILLDGKVAMAEYGHWAPTASESEANLGIRQFDAGEHVLTVETVRGHGDSKRCFVGLEGITIKTSAAAEPPVPVVCFSEPADIEADGLLATMTRTGPVRAGETKRFFSVVSVEPAGADASIDCATDSTGRSAMAAVPWPLGMYAGEDTDDVKAELLVVDAGHLYGKGVSRVGEMVQSDVPLELDWRLDDGTIEFVAGSAGSMTLAVQEADALTLDGQPWEPGGGAAQQLAFPEGRHRVTGAVLTAEARLPLEGALARARQVRAQSMRESFVSPAEVPALPQQASFDFAEGVTDLITAPLDGTAVCVAEGNRIHVVHLDGSEVRTLETDGRIRVLRWWDEARLLLAGCADEKVIAFEEAGQRKWTFFSEMDPAVFRAAKTYWFKSAPGHEGIHGLHTGVFLDGKSQAFVGSACTLEILDENGQLVKRMPQFWGKVSTMRIVPRPDGSLVLLAARKYNGTNTLGVVSNRSLNPSVRSFYSTPPGHTHMPGWSSMNRYHIFLDDFDGDGTDEVMTEINGSWNRVTVWDVGGTAKYDASFGPGKRIPIKTMRDIDTGDFDGDGIPEIVTVTSGRMAVMLTGKCEKVWGVRTEGVPTVMNCLRAKGAAYPSIVIGFEGGLVHVLDEEGHVVRLAQAKGTPSCILPVKAEDGTAYVVFGTEEGNVAAFRLEL